MKNIFENLFLPHVYKYMLISFFQYHTPYQLFVSILFFTLKLLYSYIIIYKLL